MQTFIIFALVISMAIAIFIVFQKETIKKLDIGKILFYIKFSIPVLFVLTTIWISELWKKKETLPRLTVGIIFVFALCTVPKFIRVLNLFI